MAQALNYAKQYSRALSQAFPYSLYFGALYNTPNNRTFRWINARTIEIPSIQTTGRVDADRDTIVTAQRNFTNAWEPKVLQNERKWSTLVHPQDIVETNMTATIANITRVMNEEQKFPEMDAYCVSKIFSDWTAIGKTANTTAITESSVLAVFDQLMLNMDNARVPVTGRILYCTNEVKVILKNAEKISRYLEVEGGEKSINRIVSRLDEVEIVGVPAPLMRTQYDFTEGWAPTQTAKQINMFLVHPVAVITPVTYTFARLDEPSAGSEGKYIYYEESFEDVFILNNKADAIQFNISDPSSFLEAPTVVVMPSDGSVYGVDVSDIQTNVAIADSDIGDAKFTGTLKNLTGSNAITDVWGEGNFLALTFTSDDWTKYTSVKVGLYNSAGAGMQELIGHLDDLDSVFKITNKTNQRFQIIATNGTQTVTKIFMLGDLVCQS